jgi:hypothetical protein
MHKQVRVRAMLAVDRNTKEKQRENTDGPDVAQPTGEHGAPDWFLAGGIRGPLFRIQGCRR